MRELELQNCYNKCILDDEYYEFFKHINCRITKDGYVYFSDVSKCQLLHRVILGIDDKKIIVDHINGNTLDNRKQNLRACTIAQNIRNSKISKNNKSGYKGVCFYKRDGVWVASIVLNRETIYLGRFETPEAAAEAYDAASIKYHGLNGVTNKELKLNPRKKIEILWKPTKFDDPSIKPGMVPLGHGKYAYVDLEDYDKVMKHGWSCSGKSYSGYAIASIGGKSISLHEFIVGSQDNKIIDHKDRNKLNCRRENLRFCTRLKNSYNKTRKDSNPGLVGVRKRSNNKWRAVINVERKRIHLGYFRTEEEAVAARDEAAKKYHGEFAVLNLREAA